MDDAEKTLRITCLESVLKSAITLGEVETIPSKETLDLWRQILAAKGYRQGKNPAGVQVEP